MHSRRDDTTKNSLFDEYQYFTPGPYTVVSFGLEYAIQLLIGIFMGLIAGFVFIVILYIGLSALMSLQVSYAAFEKDTSSTVQKKQQ